jgi:hypothetical protein
MLQLEKLILAAVVQDFFKKGMLTLRLRSPSVRQSVNQHLPHLPDFQKIQFRNYLQNAVE